MLVLPARKQTDVTCACAADSDDGVAAADKDDKDDGRYEVADSDEIDEAARGCSELPRSSDEDTDADEDEEEEGVSADNDDMGGRASDEAVDAAVDAAADKDTAAGSSVDEEAEGARDDAKDGAP